LQQEITPEMVAAVQHDYQIQKEEKKKSHVAHHYGFGVKHSQAEVVEQ